MAITRRGAVGAGEIPAGPTQRLTSALVLWFIGKYITVLDARTKQPRPMVLYPAQVAFLVAVFDRLTFDGQRLVIRALFSAVKKMGKTAFFAAIILAHFLLEPESNKEIILSAFDLDQTEFMFRAIVGMIQRNAWLAQSIRIEKTRLIYDDKLGTHTLTRIARDTMGAHGGSPSLVVFDEFWTQGDGSMLSALSLSPVRSEPLILATSYAGYEEDQQPGKPLYDWWLKLQPGAEPDPSFHGVWLTDVDALREVPWWTEKYMAEQARVLASEPGAFDRLMRNRWAQSSHGMFTPTEASGVFDPSLRPVVLAA